MCLCALLLSLDGLSAFSITTCDGEHRIHNSFSIFAQSQRQKRWKSRYRTNKMAMKWKTAKIFVIRNIRKMNVNEMIILFLERKTLTSIIQSVWSGEQHYSRFNDPVSFCIYVKASQRNGFVVLYNINQSLVISYCMHVKEQNENWHLLVIWAYIFSFIYLFLFSLLFYAVVASHLYGTGMSGKWNDCFGGEENRVIVCAHNIAFVEHIIFINFNFTWDNVRSVWCVNFHILLSRSLSLFLWHSNGCDKLKSIKIINSPCLSRFTKTTQHSQSCHRCERARHWVSSFIIKYTKFWSIHWGIKTVIWIPTKKYIDCKVLSTKRQFYFSHSFCLRLVKSISYHQFSAVQIRSGKILVK